MAVKRKNKGFTLMEMLIVVAIVAILVAISIPIFVNRLEKIRETADLANARSAYSQLLQKSLEGDKSPEPVTIQLTQMTDGWQTSLPITVGNVTYKGTDTENWLGTPKGRGTCVVSYDAEKGVIFDWSGNGAHKTYSGEMESAKSLLRSEFSKREEADMQSNHAFYSTQKITIDGKTVNPRIYYAGSAAYADVLASYTPKPASYAESPFYDIESHHSSNQSDGFAYYTYADDGSIKELTYVNSEKVYRTFDEGKTWYDITP